MTLSEGKLRVRPILCSWYALVKATRVYVGASRRGRIKARTKRAVQSRVIANILHSTSRWVRRDACGLAVETRGIPSTPDDSQGKINRHECIIDILSRLR